MKKPTKIIRETLELIHRLHGIDGDYWERQFHRNTRVALVRHELVKWGRGGLWIVLTDKGKKAIGLEE